MFERFNVTGKTLEKLAASFPDGDDSDVTDVLALLDKLVKNVGNPVEFAANGMLRFRLVQKILYNFPRRKLNYHVSFYTREDDQNGISCYFIVTKQMAMALLLLAPQGIVSIEHFPSSRRTLPFGYKDHFNLNDM